MAKTVQVTCAGELGIADQLARMQRWTEDRGIRITDLRAIRIHMAHEATFEEAAEAGVFVRAFDQNFRR